MSARTGVKQQVQAWLAAVAVLGLGALLSCGEPASVTAAHREVVVDAGSPHQKALRRPASEPLLAEAPADTTPAPSARCEPHQNGEPVSPMLMSEDGLVWVCPKPGDPSWSDGYAPIHKNPVFVTNAEGTVTSLGTLELRPPSRAVCPQGQLEEVLPVRGGACFLEFHFDTDCCDASGDQGLRLRCAVGEEALSRPNQTLEVMLSETRAHEVLRPGCLDALDSDGDVRDCYDRTYETSARRDFFLVEDGDADVLCVGSRDGLDSTGAEAFRLSADGIEELLDLPPACDGLSPAVSEERRR